MSDAPDDDTRHRHKSGPKSQSTSFLRTAITIMVVAAIIHFFIVPLIGQFPKAWQTIRKIDPRLGLLAVAFELTAWALYGRMTQLLVPKAVRPSLWVCFGASVASKGVTHVVPAGAAATFAVDYKLLRQAGIPNDHLVYALSVESILSAVVLNVLLAISLIFTIATSGAQTSYWVAMVLGLALFVGVGFLAYSLVRRTDRTATVIGRLLGWIPRLDEHKVRASVRNIGHELGELLVDPNRMVRLIIDATLNWVLGAAALWATLLALHQHLNFFSIFVAYALANVVSVIPITPGGLGIYEAVMIPTLMAFGLPRAAAVAGVVTFRLINFWLPIPLGAVCYIWTDQATTDHPSGWFVAVRNAWRRIAQQPAS